MKSYTKRRYTAALICSSLTRRRTTPAGAALGVGPPTFSFSSSSLGAELSLILRPEAPAPTRDVMALGARRTLEDSTPGAVVCFVDAVRTTREAVGVGEPTEERGAFAAGGPIEPVAFGAAEALALTRTLLLSALGMETGVSRPRCLSLPVSESADGGLTMPGVTMEEDSRRECAILAGAGVLPAVPLTPSFLLS